ncbi:MAG: hypothetical protein Q8M09_17570 [Pseudomonadota bacterium]|nr:hypothetical protein [Pseudomonadota bacterium]MDP1906028.1 hypothetical protein [Pseudomonadota bacterium]MDP2352499.1 hypothetical protein [Pseudomonadota bacterium]
MSAKKRIVLIHTSPEQTGMPGLAEALSRAGADVTQFVMTGDYAALLDVLEDDVLPVVIKA